MLMIFYIVLMPATTSLAEIQIITLPVVVTTLFCRAGRRERRVTFLSS